MPAWIMRGSVKPDARLRLFCFPFGGGGASAFRAWGERMPAGVELCPVQLPGRENRLREEPFDRLDPLLTSLAEALQPELDRPFVFFGHSMGALTSFELTRRLRRQGLQPARLLASAFRGPQLPDRNPIISHLPDDEFLEELRRYNGTDEAVLGSAELMRLLMPIVRADLALCEAYSYEPSEPLACPITALGGLEDPYVNEDEMAGWREQTTGAFKLRMFSGHHFFLLDNQEAVLRAVGEELEDVLAT